MAPLDKPVIVVGTLQSLHMSSNTPRHPRIIPSIGIVFTLAEK